jgi:hypothetical protein
MIDKTGEIILDWLDYINHPETYKFKLKFYALPFCVAVILGWFVFSFVFGSKKTKYS